MTTQGRSKGERIDIDYSSTQAFFDKRGKAEYANVLSATMYQDNHPELVERRDATEKSVLAPQLRLGIGSRVLDIGSGIGRWGWFVHDQAPEAHYLGIDFSASLVEKAEAEAIRRGKPQLRFQVMSATAIAPDALALAPPYDLVIISGLLIYLNDQDCLKLLAQASQLCAPGGQIYLREPVGVSDRFTLDRFYSSELQHEYSAIYRTIDELDQLLARALEPGQFSVRAADFLFAAELEKRAETRQYYTIVQKAAQP
ncbi:class I SAM-dependent methyltransferase [Pseudomonas entomophila]|uniref:class I SAM-dependent methyltransferase n=1 Tax=Pseudomonas entomophila TaxID=312306 RepID=UPI0023D7FB30|nr:class I SAM-dependent methyltransferase [Pseudomonas entomophila]MDF0731915.1 class I SAM-dependent methyltransferase [Pseudomonas entomophila]